MLDFIFLLINLIIMVVVNFIGWIYVMSSIEIKKLYCNKFDALMIIYYLINLILFFSSSDNILFNFLIDIKKFEIFLIMFFIVFNRIIKLKIKNYYTKNPQKLNKRYNEYEWNESEDEFIDKIIFYKNIQIFDIEKKEVIQLNNKNIFSLPLFNKKIVCRNVEQICFILNLRYGEYEKIWKIKNIKIDNNIIFLQLLKENNTYNLKFIKYA